MRQLKSGERRFRRNFVIMMIPKESSCFFAEQAFHKLFTGAALTLLVLSKILHSEVKHLGNSLSDREVYEILWSNAN